MRCYIERLADSLVASYGLYTERVEIKIAADEIVLVSLDNGATWIPNAGPPTSIAVVPEPGTVSLVGLGVIGVGVFLRRRRA